MDKILANLAEVRAIIAILITLALIAAILTGRVDVQQFVVPFLTMLGFYFGAKSAETP